jgi:hypothetical protein
MAETMTNERPIVLLIARGCRLSHQAEIIFKMRSCCVDLPQRERAWKSHSRPSPRSVPSGHSAACDQVEATADWRRRQAEYFPHDDRNARAAKELERLAAEVDQLEGSSVHEQIRLATDRLKDEDWFAMSKSVYAELRSVGFDNTYESGLRFLEWYCDRLRGRSAASPVVILKIPN